MDPLEPETKRRRTRRLAPSRPEPGPQPSASSPGPRRVRQLVPAPPIAPQPLLAARRERQLGESRHLKAAVLGRPLPRSLGQVVEDLAKQPVTEECPCGPASGPGTRGTMRKASRDEGHTLSYFVLDVYICICISV